MKLLIWVLIIVLVVAWLIRGKQSARQRGTGQPSRRASARDKNGEAILACRHCGLHVPASEAITHASGAVFCCEEHRHQVFPGT